MNGINLVRETITNKHLLSININYLYMYYNHHSSSLPCHFFVSLTDGEMWKPIFSSIQRT